MEELQKPIDAYLRFEAVKMLCGVFLSKMADSILDLKPLRCYVEFSEQNGRPNLKNVLFKFRS